MFRQRQTFPPGHAPLPPWTCRPIEPSRPRISKTRSLWYSGRGDERLQQRINQLLDRIEATLKQSLRMAATQGEMGESADVGAHANLLVCYVIGRWQQFAKSGFTRDPAAQWPVQAAILLGK